MTKTDEDLYCDVCAGSHPAFKALYERYEGRLYGYLRRRLDPAEAEEIFQDVMMTVLRATELSLEPGSFAAWIYKVAHRQALNVRRSRSRATVAHVRLAQEPGGASVQETPETELEAAQRRHQLDVAAESLSRPLRDVFDHRKSGRSQEEIAVLLNLPVGTVKSRMHLMVAQLRKEVRRWTAK